MCLIKIKNLIDKIYQQRTLNNPIQNSDIDILIESFYSLLKELHKKDEMQIIYQEVISISDKLYQLKSEIVLMGGKSLGENSLSDATKDLSDINITTEKYTNLILNSADKIQDIVNQSTDLTIKNTIMAEIIKIFEACNFQDITSQQIRRVKTTLNELELITKSLINIFDIKNGIQAPINGKLIGPQTQDIAPKQQDIDNLFDNG